MAQAATDYEKLATLDADLRSALETKATLEDAWLEAAE